MRNESRARGTRRAVIVAVTVLVALTLAGPASARIVVGPGSVRVDTSDSICWTIVQLVPFSRQQSIEALRPGVLSKDPFPSNYVKWVARLKFAPANDPTPDWSTWSGMDRFQWGTIGRAGEDFNVEFPSKMIWAGLNLEANEFQFRVKHKIKFYTAAGRLKAASRWIWDDQRSTTFWLISPDPGGGYQETEWGKCYF